MALVLHACRGKETLTRPRAVFLASLLTRSIRDIRALMSDCGMPPCAGGRYPHQNCETIRSVRVTEYLRNAGKLEVAQQIERRCECAHNWPPDRRNAQNLP
jgi:hypothetical protein